MAHNNVERVFEIDDDEQKLVDTAEVSNKPTNPAQKFSLFCVCQLVVSSDYERELNRPLKYSTKLVSFARFHLGWRLVSSQLYKVG